MMTIDGERDRVVRDLTRFCGDGRLTLDELEDRVTEAYAATTQAQLDHAMRDLPRSPAPVTDTPRSTPSASVHRHAPKSKQISKHDAVKGAELALKIHLVVYLSVIALLVAIWFLTTPFGYPWPIWPALSWGVAIAIHAGVTKAVVTANRD